jgi:PhnB protein
MSFVGTYLNFQLQTEEAFNFYKEVFNPSAKMFMQRFSDTPMAANLPEHERNGVMHAALEIMDGHKIFGTDMLESMNHKVEIGNNTTISLNFDSREEADRIYAKLSVGSKEGVAPHQEPWGYWGVCLDKFGIRWMFNVQEVPTI